MTADRALQDTGALLDLLGEWEHAGWLRGVDRVLVRFLREQVPAAPPLTLLLAALTSHQAGRGHVCLDLDGLLEAPDRMLSLPPEGAERGLPRPSDVLRGLDRAALDTALEGHRICGVDEDAGTPLVRAQDRLYLRRYREAERRIGEGVAGRLCEQPAWREGLDAHALRTWLDRLFGLAEEGDGEPDWQRLACVLAAGSAFSVITGGPGTGKTYTVLQLLALLQGLQGEGEPLRIRLAAPTGKAAARLNASVAGAVDALGLERFPGGERLRAAIPREVVTLHRLLGARPDTRRFRHDARNPLPVDVLVVDEASMVDLELMASLMAAVPAHARLVLLGDRDQLASVEAGAVLGELCARADGGHYAPQTVAWLREVAGLALPAGYVDEGGQALDQHVAMLRRSRRFGADSGIGRLAAAVNDGTAEVTGHPGEDVHAAVLQGPDDPALLRRVLDGAGHADAAPFGVVRYLEHLTAGRPASRDARDAWEEWARGTLREHGRFQLLCAVREGPWGVDRMNRRVAGALTARGVLQAEGAWYEGRPVIVTRNDYALGLINGDIGVTLRVPAWLARGDAEPGADDATETALRVAFVAADGHVRWMIPQRLESVETAFALTVHKSQGSEFEHVAFLLPPPESPLLTRELAYTAITRASGWLSLFEPQAGVLQQASRQPTRRSGGLRTWLSP
ncbi:exodeoxyribonuclease V subunit alpha [Thioalkalivibrio thiocyanoxidans]|uniref:exodeoxyribonuclease V subunit alpha n=1 Tax=Thioalkalivibrio thiocyanoxidans TaxID=152475 RepID=UPI00036638E0|nr:exodeoxyribonuclease V subunit alpha [Thioalkalivibrio thiocyanoxidans]